MDGGAAAAATVAVPAAPTPAAADPEEAGAALTGVPDVASGVKMDSYPSW